MLWTILIIGEVLTVENAKSSRMRILKLLLLKKNEIDTLFYTANWLSLTDHLDKSNNKGIPAYPLPPYCTMLVWDNELYGAPGTCGFRGIEF